MAPGASSKFGASVFEPEVFRKQVCCGTGLFSLAVTVWGHFVDDISAHK